MKTVYVRHTKYGIGVMIEEETAIQTHSVDVSFGGKVINCDRRQLKPLN